MKRMKCYIYTRVSTSMQVDGYSLDAQKDKLRKYAEFQNMLVAGEYCDEGKSGKNIEGRPEFLRMLRDIESGKDGVSFVLVFKLSRFGRNAADVLTSLQRMQDFGVNLICVEDGIDSSKDSGKLMISVLSAVAEIERENILVQTMEGRRQKAREGKWNGGFAPYGYKLVDGHLQIAEEEAEVIRIIYDKYIHTTMGTARIANWLNEHGYSKVCRHNNKREAFTDSFLIGVLDNPVYCGKLAYGRRHNEKIPGTRNQYHIVKQKDYTLYDGIHEPIISEEDWQLAQKQRQQTNKHQLKTHSLDHEHVLSGLLKCPVCGGGMYGNVNRKKKGDGTYYRDYFYYACKHRLHVDGKRCDYHHQWGEEIIDGAVEEIIHKLVNTPAFEQGIREKIGGKLARHGDGDPAQAAPSAHGHQGQAGRADRRARFRRPALHPQGAGPAGAAEQGLRPDRLHRGQHRRGADPHGQHPPAPDFHRQRLSVPALLRQAVRPVHRSGEKDLHEQLHRARGDLPGATERRTHREAHRVPFSRVFQGLGDQRTLLGRNGYVGECDGIG